MNYEKITKSAEEDIEEFFLEEFGWDCKDEFSKRLNEYRLEVENDKYHCVKAEVYHTKKVIIINEYYNEDMEILLCTMVHELSHVLSNKNVDRDDFVEEGIIELLTYKILYKKVSQKTLAKYFEQSCYIISVCMMDTVYLLDKNIILSYIRDNDGYDNLLAFVDKIPVLASAILSKPNGAYTLSTAENEALLEILQQRNFEFSDLCCNIVLIEMAKKMQLPNMPLIVKNKSEKYQMKEKEKSKIYKCFLDGGYRALESINYAFGDLISYENTDIWNYIFDLTEKLDSAENIKLFNQDIYNQILAIILSNVSAAFNGKKQFLKKSLIKNLGISNESLVNFYCDYAVQQERVAIKLDSDDLNKILNIFLKNELLADSIVEQKIDGLNNVLLEIIDKTYSRYKVVDFYVMNLLFEKLKQQIVNYDEYFNACNNILKKYGIAKQNCLADPNSIWIKGIKIDEANYLSCLASLGTTDYCANVYSDYFLQCLNYFVLENQEKDFVVILKITNDWFNDAGLLDYKNEHIINNYKSFVEWQCAGEYLIKSEFSQFDILINNIAMLRKQKLNDDEILHKQLNKQSNI